jgi:hypothetical protein
MSVMLKLSGTVLKVKGFFFLRVNLREKWLEKKMTWIFWFFFFGG